MKNIMLIILVTLFSVNIIISEEQNPSPSHKGTGVGDVTLTVVYPDLMLYYWENGGGISEKTSETSGELNLGPYFPPSLNDATTEIDGKNYYMADPINNGNPGNWSTVFIPFYVKGALGATIKYVITEPIANSSNPETDGVLITNGNLTGCETTNGLFKTLPLAGTAVMDWLGRVDLSDNLGKYYFRMHFKDVYIKFAAKAGVYTFETTLTCDYY